MSTSPDVTRLSLTSPLEQLSVVLLAEKIRKEEARTTVNILGDYKVKQDLSDIGVKDIRAFACNPLTPMVLQRHNDFTFLEESRIIAALKRYGIKTDAWKAPLPIAPDSDMETLAEAARRVDDSLAGELRSEACRKEFAAAGIHTAGDLAATNSGIEKRFYTRKQIQQLHSLLSKNGMLPNWKVPEITLDSPVLDLVNLLEDEHKSGSGSFKKFLTNAGARTNRDWTLMALLTNVHGTIRELVENPDMIYELGQMPNFTSNYIRQLECVLIDKGFKPVWSMPSQPLSTRIGDGHESLKAALEYFRSKRNKGKGRDNDSGPERV